MGEGVGLGREGVRGWTRSSCVWSSVRRPTPAVAEQSFRWRSAVGGRRSEVGGRPDGRSVGPTIGQLVVRICTVTASRVVTPPVFVIVLAIFSASRASSRNMPLMGLVKPVK